MAGLELAGAAAVVTGGASGIGAAPARRLAAGRGRPRQQIAGLDQGRLP